MFGGGGGLLEIRSTGTKESGGPRGLGFVVQRPGLQGRLFQRFGGCRHGPPTGWWGGGALKGGGFGFPRNGVRTLLGVVHPNGSLPGPRAPAPRSPEGLGFQEQAVLRGRGRLDGVHDSDRRGRKKGRRGKAGRDAGPGAASPPKTVRLQLQGRLLVSAWGRFFHSILTGFCWAEPRAGGVPWGRSTGPLPAKGRKGWGRRMA